MRSTIVNIFLEQQIIRDRNTLAPKDIVEKAAIGFIFAFFLQVRPNLSNIKVCLTGEGYDYKCRDNGLLIKIEVSGVNSNNLGAFSNRITKKRNHFERMNYEPRGAEEYLGIVDFVFNRYIMWDIR